jgi:ABC-type antimicrobial peptide transport system permease subunit
MAGIGLYALVAFTVEQRSREIGVRIALGASGPRVLREFYWRGLRMTALGVTLGIPLGLVAFRLFISEIGMPEVATGPAVAGTILAVVFVTSIATILPALRASSMDPITALRAD